MGRMGKSNLSSKPHRDRNEVARYKTKLIEELDFAIMLALKNDKSLVTGLMRALEIIEGEEA